LLNVKLVVHHVTGRLQKVNLTICNEVYKLWLSGVQVHLHTGRSLTESTIPDAVLIQFYLLMKSTVLLETYKG